MAEKLNCLNCGDGFLAHREKEVLCFACEMLFQAVEPPEVLKDLRLVYRGDQPITHPQQALFELFRTDISKFTDRMVRAEDQYRAALVKYEAARVAKLAVGSAVDKWDGKGVCSGCGRGPSAVVEVVETSTPKLIEKVQKWIVGQPKGVMG